MTTTQTVIAADLIQLDARTDVRQTVCECDAECCEMLTDELAAGEATLMPGLQGWGNHTHTLRRHADGRHTAFHVTVE